MLVCSFTAVLFLFLSGRLLQQNFQRSATNPIQQQTRAYAPGNYSAAGDVGR